MKIAQFIASNEWGGAEKVFVSLCNELAENHEVTALTYPNPGIVQSLDPRVRQIVIPCTSRYNLRVYWILYQIIRNHAFDVVHTHCAKATRMVHSLGRFLSFLQVATKHNPRKGKVFEKVRHVTAVSAAAVATVKQGAALIYNGIAPVAITPADQRNHPFRILAIGRLDPIKGFDHLVDQAARLEMDFLLEIIGDGPQRQTLQRRIDEAQLNHKVKLTGYCTHIAERMAEADLVIISSHSEGFPLVLVESLFYAKVLISTPVGGCSEILDPALLVAQENLMHKALEVASDYAAYRNRFRAIQEVNRDRFLIQSVANSYVEFYLSLHLHE